MTQINDDFCDNGLWSSIHRFLGLAVLDMRSSNDKQNFFLLLSEGLETEDEE